MLLCYIPAVICELIKIEYSIYTSKTIVSQGQLLFDDAYMLLQCKLIHMYITDDQQATVYFMIHHFTFYLLHVMYPCMRLNALLLYICNNCASLQASGSPGSLCLGFKILFFEYSGSKAHST